MTPDSTCRIRPAEARDIDTLSAFARAMFVATFGAQNQADDLAMFLDTTFTPALQRAEFESPSRRYALLELDGVLAGYALLNDGAREAGVTGAHPVELQRFYLDHAWHGRGLAARLMTHVIEVARAMGGDVLWLGVWEENPRAIRFYGKQGFVTVGHHVFLVGTDAQRDLVMQRPLR